ncbi:putative AdoMet-dependent methyltransferase-like protein [Elsinoe fawcettii]|nr:putative AdoMet-dependent methyltransferase-like protein [Elsinoe fawcettii]
MAPQILPLRPAIGAPNTSVDGNTGRTTPESLLLEQILSEHWEPTSWTPTTFLPEHFEKCMNNLLRNPNVLSSHLFRADILYDSNNDKALLDWSGEGIPYPDPDTSHTNAESSDKNAACPKSLAGHMRAELRPRTFNIKSFRWKRTVVRELVPRNQNLDKKTVQTVHFFSRSTSFTQPIHSEPTPSTSSQTDAGKTETSLVFYLPHITQAEDMPFYHPQVRGLCFVHSCPISPHSPSSSSSPTSPLPPEGGLAVHILPFPSHPLPTLPKLPRITTNLLTTISKHAHGAQTGYEKRVHHDLVIPQRRFQDTYARLKEKYAKALCRDWKEVTDPGKHVFEDVGIAAFLIELWGDLYGSAGEGAGDQGGRDGKKRFPGFVDIGCGNGLLVYLLRMEGYEGRGFDVRERKSWGHYPENVREGLREMTLVPDVLANTQGVEEHDGSRNGADKEDQPGEKVVGGRRQHNGIFEPGTFIISNHADELTPWTPLLGYMNNSPWIAIPCCSHDLGGRRFRAPNDLRSIREQKKNDARSVASLRSRRSSVSSASLGSDYQAGDLRGKQAAETGSLKIRHAADEDGIESAKDMPEKGTADQKRQSTKPDANKNGGKAQGMSAYAALCNYVSQLADAVEYVPETEMLRIPSTRNACIVGRKTKSTSDTGFDEAEKRRRRKVVQELVESEMNLPLEEISKEWLHRAGLIAGKKGEGH